MHLICVQRLTSYFCVWKSCSILSVGCMCWPWAAAHALYHTCPRTQTGPSGALSGRHLCTCDSKQDVVGCTPGSPCAFPVWPAAMCKCEGSTSNIVSSFFRASSFFVVVCVHHVTALRMAASCSVRCSLSGFCRNMPKALRCLAERVPCSTTLCVQCRVQGLVSLALLDLFRSFL